MSAEVCRFCSDPTRRVVGFADYEDGSGGQIYSCDNLECKLKVQVDEATADVQSIKDNTKSVNVSQEINMEGLKRLRVESCILIYDISQKFNITVAQYSAYENLYQPIPKDTYTAIVDFVKEIAKGRGNDCWSRYGLL